MNERIQEFMFNPYTCQRTAGVIGVSVNNFGVPSDGFSNQSENHQPKFHYSMNNDEDAFSSPSSIHREQPKKNQSLLEPPPLLDRNDLFFSQQNHSLHPHGNTYNFLHRDLDISKKRGTAKTKEELPIYEHRPVDTSQQEYVRN